MRALVLTLCLAATPVFAAQVDDTAALALARPARLIVEPGMPAAKLAALLKPVDAFYGFWNNGSPKLLAAAVAPNFIDHTLPPGRPQGPTGPQFAANGFLGAVPDVKAEVVLQLVVGDRVVTHLHFTGHFTGTFMGAQGTGQPVDFIATDILQVTNGKITDNWHLEDNLTFLKQLGLVK